MDSAVTAVPATPAPERAAVWEDFLDIFYTPSSVFARREHGSFWIPLLVVSVLVAILMFANAGVLDPIYAAEANRGIARAVSDPRMTPEMADQMRSMGTSATKIAGMLATPFLMVAMAFAVWVVGRMMGARPTWHAALVVAAYSFIPRVPESVLMGVQGFLVDPSQLDGLYRLTLGAGRFLDPDTTSPIMVALFGRLDLFTLWVTALLAIGLAVTGRMDRRQAVLAGALIWIIGGLPAILGALWSSLRG